MPFSSPASTRGKAIAAALAVLLALTASLLTLLHSSAHAAINPRITISNLSLVISSATGDDDPNNDYSRVDDIMRLSFNWDASNANASAGDSFRIGLPELFHNREQLTQDLKVSHAGSEVTIGECVLGEQDITCTFNGQLDTLKGQGFNNPKGSGSALLKAVKATDEATASIDANGTVTPVPIPGGSIADNTGLRYSPETLRKWAEGVDLDSTSIKWEVSLGFPGLNNALQAAGKNPITTDGQTRSTIVLTDELGPGHAYVTDKAQWTLQIGTSSTRNALIGTVTNAAGQDSNTAEGDFDLDVVLNDNRATITVTGPFKQDTNYHVYYNTTPSTDDQRVRPGIVYTNKAGLQGTDLEAGDRAYYIRSFNINVDLQPGFGGFKATKLLTGAGAPAIPDGTTFDLTVDYTLPGGATTDAYQGWAAPGTVNQDRTGGRTTLQLTAGSSATYNGTFPTGTVLTLSEDTGTASATPQGLAWGEPAFMVGDQATNTLTIQEQASTPVSVTNTVTEVPAGPGRFSVTKALEGDGDFTASTFTYTYTCDNGAQGSLQVPGDGTAVNSPELPHGTTCTLAEDVAAAQRDGYTLTPRLSQDSVTIAEGTVVAVVGTNTYKRATGTFSVTKHVLDQNDLIPLRADGAAPAQGGDAAPITDMGLNQKEFTFTYTCDDPGQTKGALTVKGDGVAVEAKEQLPVGTTCTITEDEAGAQVKGTVLTTVIDVDGARTTGRTASFDIKAGATVDVAATNIYEHTTGTFAVSKGISDGTPEPGPQEPGEPLIQAVTAGVTAADEDEAATTADEAEDATAVQAEDAEGAASDGAADSDAAAQALAALATKEFTFTYTCDDPAQTTGTITVKGDGLPVEAPHQLPVGTTCTVSEDEESAQAEGLTLTAPAPQKVTVGADQEPATLRFVNVYTPKKPEPSPSPSPSPAPSPEPTPSATPSPEPTPSTTPSPEPTPSTTPTPEPTPSTTPEPGPVPSQDPTPGMPAPDPSPSHTCLTPAPSSSGTPGEPGADPSASGTPEPGATGPGGDPSTDPCAPPVSPDPGGSSLARTGASLGAVLVAIVGLVGGAAVLSHRRRV